MISLGAVVLSAACAWGQQAGKLDDVVIKGTEKGDPSLSKPAFDLTVDPYETIRPSLKPDESMLLAQSPGVVTWGRSRPELLRNEHLIEPWNDFLRDVDDLRIPIANVLTAPGKKPLSWSASIVDEDGKPFRTFEGRGAPPADIAWNGRSEQGEWIKAGHAYSPVYRLSESTATARTLLGAPIQFAGLVHPEEGSTLIGLDSSQLFGSDRRAAEIVEAGRPLLRSAADWMRRRGQSGLIRVKAYGTDPAGAQAQGGSVKRYLAEELDLAADKILIEAAAAPASEQRVDLLVSR